MSGATTASLVLEAAVGKHLAARMSRLGGIRNSESPTWLN